MSLPLEAPTPPALSPQTADLRDPRWLTHPRDMARHLHAQGRVHRDPQGLWLLTGHADCRAVMQASRLSRDPRLSSAYAALRPFGAGSALEQAAERFMLFNDPPVHTRMRRIVGAAFTPAAIRHLQAGIEACCHELLAACPDDEPFDFMQCFAQVLPVRVVCDMLGIDAGDFAQTKAWSDAASCVVEPLASRADRALGAQAVAALAGLLRDQVERRRRQPGNTVLDLMIAAQRDDPKHDDDELLANLILLFIAGHETTTNWLGNGLLALLQHPQQLQRLRDQPALMPAAVEEMLRWESPVNMVARTTVEPWSLGDLVVPPGEVLYVLLGAAHQDAAAIADPGRFDIGRDPNPQLAFGGGVHYCVGAPLARLEATTAFSALLQRFAHLELAEDTLRWRPMINLRGLQRLRVQGRR